MPSQWNGAVSRSPRTGMVLRGMIWLPPVTIGVSSTQSNWSVWPSGWQLAQANVPVVDAFAVLNAIRPRLNTGCVGSSSAIVATAFGFARSERSTRVTVSARAFNTQAEPPSRAMPRGPAPTSTRPSTAPLAASTVNSLSDAAAVATSVASSGVAQMANGVANESSRLGWTGGSGSRSKNTGFSALPSLNATLVMRFRNARFSISFSPCFLVPLRPFASLRASVWATNTFPLPSTARP